MKYRVLNQTQLQTTQGHLVSLRRGQIIDIPLHDLKAIETEVCDLVGCPLCDAEWKKGEPTHIPEELELNSLEDYLKEKNGFIHAGVSLGILERHKQALAEQERVVREKAGKMFSGFMRGAFKEDLTAEAFEEARKIFDEELEKALESEG